MILRPTAAAKWAGAALCCLSLLLLVGCATSSGVDWDERVGVYTWENAIAELGEPSQVVDLEGGVKSAEWVTARGAQSATAAEVPTYLRAEPVEPEQLAGRYAPPKVIRLSFTPEGKLLDWSKNY